MRLLPPILPSLVLAGVLLAGCDVGEGNKAESIRFVSVAADGTTTAKDSETIFECFTESVTVQADFTDGIPGDFTQRVRYTSSDESRLRISNGDIPVPGNNSLVYSRGVLVPVAPTTAPVIITAEFAGLTAQMPVTVRTPTSILVSNEQMTDSDGSTRHAVTQMVPGSSQQLRAIAVLDEGSGPAESDVTLQGSWTTTAPTETAVISASTGLVSAVAVPAVATTHAASVSFPACSAQDGAPPPPSLASEQLRLTTNFQVSAPVALRIVTEPGHPKQGERMVARSSQFLRVLADFDDNPANGEGQDLTLRGSLKIVSEPSTAFSYSSFTALLLAGPLTGAPLPAVVTAEFGTNPDNDDEPAFVSQPLNLTVVPATLDSLSISPTAATIAPRGTQQFTVTGRFTVSGESEPFVQRVDHSVIYSSSDEAKVNISNLTLSAGIASSLLSEATTEPVTITATSNNLINCTANPDPTQVCPTDLVPKATATLSVSASTSP